MTEIKYMVGDATEPQCAGARHVVHICNDLGYWGAGFVKAISGTWSEPEKQYKQWKKNQFADTMFALGEIQPVPVANNITVVNMIAQEGVFWGNKPPIRYKALEECLLKVVALNPKSVHMPRIGCGLAGGKWEEVEKVITKTLLEANIPVFVYDLHK